MKVSFISGRVEFKATVVSPGPAGVGCALALRRAEVESVLVVEAETIGTTFRRWRDQMRLNTPSFHGNPFFQTDLNAVTPDTSPGDFLQKEQLRGREYADDRQAVARRLGYPEPDLENDRLRGFLIDDWECCTNCDCAVEWNAEPVGIRS